MLAIERSDKKLDPRCDEIQQDWRNWASKNGYKSIDSVPIAYNDMHIPLEILENQAQEDAYLVYLPSVPRTTGGETLYIVPNQEQLTFTVDAAKKLVLVAMLMVQEKLKSRKHKLN